MLSLGLFSTIAPSLSPAVAHFWDVSTSTKVFLHTISIVSHSYTRSFGASPLSTTKKNNFSAFPASLFFYYRAQKLFAMPYWNEWELCFHPWKEIPSFRNYQWKWSLHTIRKYIHKPISRLPRVHETSIKTLIIWENLRNCVFHVTFLLLFCF